MLTIFNKTEKSTLILSLYILTVDKCQIVYYNEPVKCVILPNARKFACQTLWNAFKSCQLVQLKSSFAIRLDVNNLNCHRIFFEGIKIINQTQEKKSNTIESEKKWGKNESKHTHSVSERPKLNIHLHDIYKLVYANWFCGVSISIYSFFILLFSSICEVLSGDKHDNECSWNDFLFIHTFANRQIFLGFLICWWSFERKRNGFCS